MASKMKKSSPLKAEVFNEVGKDGIETYGFKLIDESGTVVLINNASFEHKKDAITTLTTVIENVKGNPKSFQVQKTKMEQYYFIVLNEEGSYVAKGTQLFKTNKGAAVEVERIKSLFGKTEMIITENISKVEPMDEREVTKDDVKLVDGIDVLISDEPCKKDPKLCELYEQILAIYQKCLGEEIRDYEPTIGCFREIINLIYDFDKGNPKYDLTKVLSEEISIINAFLSRPSVKGYSTANNAVLGILKYLLATGDCDCGAGGEPCVRNEKVCELYDSLLIKYNTCFPDDVPDNKGEYFCARDMLELIAAFNKACPEYKLNEILEEQIATLNNYLAGKVKFEIARIAVQEILAYLLELGQCDCDNSTFELTDFASLQSSHFYIQAAGSEGDDSTKGIHLRWMLKGGLSEHLPKADYATPGINFNKPDDYVRIYRAPYTKYQVLIRFSNRPNSNDDANGIWSYAVNSEVFYIHFINTTKYAQVRATVDPQVNPLDFIKQYGDEVIEIEHKTQLSFAVTPSFTLTSGASQTFLELLSVEENIVSAPKIASLRKKYTTAALTGQELLSENIRSIRVKTSDGYLTQVMFEFYSVFIDNTNKKNGWTYLGKHALTKDTTLAHERLEPVPNIVHGKWRRYNDDAYVNIANYKDRWNGAGVPVENRILNAVDTYIDLSNDIANPTAIESFLINDPGISPDPDYDPSDDEFELSNLYVLQLASLDYHNARMLGLGVLDVDATVFNERFMYLAEYISFGDLQDGLGKREVQHIYCSLPTALADSRLPIPVNLKELVPGITQAPDTENPAVLTDVDGYAFDGKTRFISLFNEDLPEELEDQNFYYTNYEFISANSTIPVFAGIEYKRDIETDWQKPELPHDRKYLNIDSTVTADKKYETRSIAIPDVGFPLFVHREKDNGWHDYSSYGVNWFSRSVDSNVTRSIETVITPANTLEPPTNINAVLIRQENPLLLTSPDEQADLAAIVGADKTFIRLNFEYTHGQDMISYHRTINGDLVSGYVELPDADELFGEDFEVFFRNRTPISVAGKISSVSNTGNPILVEIQSGEYVLDSTSNPIEVITPSIIGNGSNFVGSVLTIDGENYRIHQVNNTGTYPKFTVFKNDSNGFPVELGSTIPPSELTAPGTGGLFLLVENMLTDTNWSLPDPAMSTTLPAVLPNPLAFKVNIDHTTVYREEVTVNILDGTVETHVKKFRGVYEDATITAFLEDFEEADGTITPNVHQGIYVMTFNGFSLAQHSQAGGTSHRVEWYNGIVRVHTQGGPNAPRKDLKVIRTEEIGTANDLVIYAVDATFDTDPSYDPIPLGVHKVNYYPGYRSYLMYDPTHNLDEDKILPDEGEGVRYCIFGLRTHDHGLGYYSKISQPVLMFAQEIVAPLQPQEPQGGKYATRPDFFGKASYTFNTVYDHKPHSVQFNRASDIQILSSIYEVDEMIEAVNNVGAIMRDIFEDREAVWFQDRWDNLLSWDYTADGGLFGSFPTVLEPGGVRLPLPNSTAFIASINAFIVEHNDHFSESVGPLGTITALDQEIIPIGTGHGALYLVDFMRDVIFNCFVPLTEVPVIYDHIKGADYQPISKKQKVRDRNGNLLDPLTDADFDMAPMMKRIGTHETQFTDFGLDGASNAKYFYTVREISIQMKTGPYSKIKGPISMVNTAPPIAPEIVKITPILADEVFQVEPGIEVQINGYSKKHKIKKIKIYRALSHIDAVSIRTMDFVSEIEVEVANIQDDPIWKIVDNFSDLGYVPYGDFLYYRVIVEREVKYLDRLGTLVIDVAPSEASKVTITNIVENSNPNAPDLAYYSTPINALKEIDMVTLSWDKTVHNGSYSVQKMNSGGNWEEIHEIRTNADLVQVPLLDTSLSSGLLSTEDAAGNGVYHHFKIVAKNFAGMISREEKILTIYNVDTWQDIAGI